MLRVASVGSGSKGNATLVASEETTLLIDCGFPAREMLSRLDLLDVGVSDIDAILADGAARAAAIARQLMAEVRDIVGFLGTSTDH